MYLNCLVQQPMQFYSHKSTNSRQGAQQSSSQQLFYGVAAGCFALTAALALSNQNRAQAEASEQQEKKDELNAVVAEDIAAPEKVEEEKKEEVEVEEEQEEELIGGVFKAVTAKNAAQLLGDQRNRRMIYLYKSKEGLAQVTQFATQLQRSMQVEPFLLDCGNEQDMEAVMAFFKDFNPKTVPQIEKEIPEKAFLLMNKYNDIWFWPDQLMQAIYQHQMEILNYFKGPDTMISEAQLVLYQSGDNDIHVVSYCANLSEQSELNKLKKFRQFHNNSEHMAGHYKFWIVEDPVVAKTLKIDTTRPTGDIYVVREANPVFNSDAATSDIFGFKFSSRRLMTAEEVQANADDAIKFLQELSFNAPMIAHDEMKFRKMLLGLPTLLVYCDPLIHGQETYDAVLRSISQARKKMPLIVNYTTEKGKDDLPEVMFVVSTTNKLPPIGMLKKDQPQAIFIKMGPNSQVDILKEYLPALEKVEGMPLAEFMEKAKNAEKEFAAAPGDDEATMNEKQHQSIVFNESRFEMQAIHQEKELKNLLDPDALLHFVNQSLNGQRPYFWLSENPKKEKSSVKVVGDSFKARVFDTKRDALVLIYHPIAHKNRGLKNLYENFAASVDDSKLLVARYNGLNESSVFKSPIKLPAIVHFSSAELEAAKASDTAAQDACADQGSDAAAVEAPFGLSGSPKVKEQTEYQFVRNHMLQSSSEEDFKKAMNEFIRQQTPNAEIFKNKK